MRIARKKEREIGKGGVCGRGEGGGKGEREGE
jgi:hypothetical protein